MPLAKTFALLTTLGLLLLIPPSTQAEWREAPPPPGGVVYSAFVADANTWLAELPGDSSPRFGVSDDGGLSWTEVPLTGFSLAYPAGAHADGSFRVVAFGSIEGDTSTLQVLRVDGSGSVEPLGPPIPEVSGNPFISVSAVDGDGATWVPFHDAATSTHKLSVIAKDGSVTTRALPDEGPTHHWEARPSVFGMRLVRVPDLLMVGVLPTGTFKLGDGGTIVPAEAYPVEYADGDLWFAPSSRRASWDGGAHWSETELTEAFVRRAPGTGTPRYLISEGAVAERYSPDLFRRTGLKLQGGATNVVDTGDSLVAWNEGSIYVHEGALPQLALEIGSLSADARRLIARANLFRADAGLPPLTGDALVSQAAHNHSAYSALNPDEMKGLAAHYETPGKAGFTGGTSSERCAAVGASCGGEVMFSPTQDPVGGWLATPYHRRLPGAPQAGVVGAGEVEKGWAVMNGGELHNVLVRPFGYPVGRWRGDEGFSGETPDPVQVCNEAGKAIDYPVGITVSFYLPREAGDVTRIEVRKEGDPTPLPGCLLHTGSDRGNVGNLVLDDPLVAGTTYRARGEWSTGQTWRASAGPGGIGTLSHEWSFSYQPDAPQGERERGRGARCGGKLVTKLGTGRRDVIVGTKRADVIDARGGNDRVRSLGGDDVICGEGGRDRLNGGRGRDRLYGNGGNDRLAGGPGKDRLYGSRGRDWLAGGPGKDRLVDGPGRDTVLDAPGRRRAQAGPQKTKMLSPYSIRSKISG